MPFEAHEAGQDARQHHQLGGQKNELRIDHGDLPATAGQLRDLLAKSGRFFDRDVAVLVLPAPNGEAPVIKIATSNNIIMEAHRVCQPLVMRKGEWCRTTLSDRLARMYLDMHGERNLRPLAGVTTAPLLKADGSILTADGYDPTTRLLCHGIPDIGKLVSTKPTIEDARAALRELREMFKTFPFADSVRISDPIRGVDVVDTTQSPATDESAFLVALLTAICRPNLQLAPGLIVSAPAISGSGSGKGLLVRAISQIAFGVKPRALTRGPDGAELDKRLGAALVEAHPILYLDNVNGVPLRSDLLASVMTEGSAMIRPLGVTRTVMLNSTTFIAATGNALEPSEDLVRRFVVSMLDPRCEDPEARDFQEDFLQIVTERRFQLLSAALTIWRFGRAHTAQLQRGRPLGSFEQWGRWCRDPLLTLGCRDPAERIAEAKARDKTRLEVAAIFAAWWKCHGQRPVIASKIADEVSQLIDPQKRGRQYVVSRLANLAGTRVSGFLLHRQGGAGKWGVDTYALLPTDPAENEPGGDDTSATTCPTGRTLPLRPMAPMAPMPNATAGGDRSPADSENAPAARRHRDHRDHRLEQGSVQSETDTAEEKVMEWTEDIS